MAKLNINGRVHEVDVPQETPLLWTLRDLLGFTGTKFGCGMALCGACTVHVDGQPTRSCVTPISALEGKAIHTIESMDDDIVGKVLQTTWTQWGVAQCGYCQGGQIMSATALLKTNPRPDDEAIRTAMSGNICRCGTYTRIHAAIKAAAQVLDGAQA
ncbi:(2Fe-2S)-binding protein [Cupriavidus necator]